LEKISVNKELFANSTGHYDMQTGELRPTSLTDGSDFKNHGSLFGQPIPVDSMSDVAKHEHRF